MQTFFQRLSQVQERIHAAAARAGRDANDIQLLAASKGRMPEELEEAVRHGVNLFGENKIQEARAKIPLGPSAARWHFIGHLQSNKVKWAATLFEAVHSVDNFSLAQALSEAAEAAGRSLDLFLEVNTSGEGSKFGLKPDALLGVAEQVNELPSVRLVGLMTMAPYSEDAERARPVFAKLRECRDRCQSELGLQMPELSMGMSGDLEAGILEGSTIVRVGTALFGPRLSARARAAMQPESFD